MFVRWNLWYGSADRCVSLPQYLFLCLLPLYSPAGHLRVANVIPSHREYMYSSTPSEPIVVEAAAQVLREESMIHLLRHWSHRERSTR